MFSEFKKFIARGSVMDLAVGVIIGAAFGKIVTSLVNDVLMPIISLVTGKIDFSDLFVSLNGQHYATLADAKKAAAPTLNYGVFANTVIEFLIVAFTIYAYRRKASVSRSGLLEAQEETSKASSALEQ